MPIEPEAITVTQSGQAGRYAYAFADGQEAELLFHERTPGVVAITYVEVPGGHRNRGVGEMLVRRVVADSYSAGKKATPLCSFARRIFEANRDWADLRSTTSV